MRLLVGSRPRAAMSTFVGLLCALFVAVAPGAVTSTSHQVVATPAALQLLAGSHAPGVAPVTGTNLRMVPNGPHGQILGFAVDAADGSPGLELRFDAAPVAVGAWASGGFDLRAARAPPVEGTF